MNLRFTHLLALLPLLLVSSAWAKHPKEPSGTDAATGDDAMDGGLSAEAWPQSGALRLLLQLRYRNAWADASQLAAAPALRDAQRATLENDNGYDVQRAFLRYVAAPTQGVEGKLMVDFAEFRHGNAKQAFKLGYVELSPMKRLQFDVGLMKRTFSLVELLPIADWELVEVGTLDDFLKEKEEHGSGLFVRKQLLRLRKLAEPEDAVALSKQVCVVLLGDDDHVAALLLGLGADVLK